MTEALNRGRLDANSRTVRFRVYDYLVSTNKPTGGKEYQRLQDALERLRGTSIKTNIKTGGQRVKEGFGIVDSWMIIEKSPDGQKARKNDAAELTGAALPAVGFLRMPRVHLSGHEAN